MAAAARVAGVPAYAVAGRSRFTPAEVTAAGFAGAFTLTDLEPDPGRCMAEAAPLLERLGEQLARHVFG